MVHRGISRLFVLLFLAAFSLTSFIPFLAHPANIPSSHVSLSNDFRRKANNRCFKIYNDKFWKEGQPFQIIAGDLHYFRVLPEYWEDRLQRAKALGLNTIQTYVPWNLHEPFPKKWVFEGIANIESFLKLAQELEFLVMLRVGPYICAEWDLGGFPAWLLAIEPALKLRSSDPAFLNLVERWWGILLPKIVPLLYENDGPIIMIQIENEFGSFGDDKSYLRYLATLARMHLGNDVILYTTDGDTNTTLKNGTIPEAGIYAAVDFAPGEDPWPIFELQKKYNPPGKSPPLSAEFYTGWLTHWGEPIAKTNASYTASYLQKILFRNGSAVLYMAHGGTNFGFFNGANSGDNESDYKADLTSYDYDAPIKESGDVDNPKFKELRNVIKKFSPISLPPAPASIKRANYGTVKVSKVASFFDVLNHLCHPSKVVESDQPMPMELVGQMFGFLLYVSQYSGNKNHQTLYIPKVHDRAQVFVLCTTEADKGSPTYIGIIKRWSNEQLKIPHIKCSSNISLFILVENMGRINFGPYIYDRKGILSLVILNDNILHGWKMYPISLDNLVLSKETLFKELEVSQTAKPSIQKFHQSSHQPRFYEARFFVDPNDQVKDTFLSFRGWNKGVAFVNNFNIGRFWPILGPQCTLYVPAPILHHRENVVIIFELHSPNPNMTIEFVQEPDFTCKKNSEYHIQNCSLLRMFSLL